MAIANILNRLLSKKDVNLIASALYLAAEWERSLAESWAPVPGKEKQAAERKAAQYLALRKKLFGPQPVELPATLVTIQESSRRLTAKKDVRQGRRTCYLWPGAGMLQCAWPSCGCPPEVNDTAKEKVL